MVSIRMTKRLENLTSDKICTMAPVSPDRGGRGVGRDTSMGNIVTRHFYRLVRGGWSCFEKGGTANQNIKKFSSLAGTGLQVVKHLVGEVILDTKPTDNSEPFEFENELRVELPQGLLMVPDKGGGGGRQWGEAGSKAECKDVAETDGGYCESKHQEVFKFGWDMTPSEVILDTKPSDNGEPFEFENELRAELPQGPVMVSIRMTQRLTNLTSDKFCTMAPVSPDRGGRGVGRGGGRQRGVGEAETEAEDE
ncbi:glycoside hydrolase family 29, partial [Striga asiatica]